VKIRNRLLWCKGGTGKRAERGVPLAAVVVQGAEPEQGGVPLAAAEPRIAAAVFGLAAHEILAGAAARVTIPVEFLLQWDTNWYHAGGA
jgi:hypothetical protein